MYDDAKNCEYTSEIDDTFSKLSTQFLVALANDNTTPNYMHIVSQAYEYSSWT